MIAALRGKVIERRPQGVVIDVQGVGYLVHCTEATAAKLPVGSEASLRVHTAVREDAIELFGFCSELEETLFHELLRVPNVGPKSALAILGGGTPEEIAQAIVAGDLARLRKLPGVGKKTAERLVLDLRDRLAPHAKAHAAASAPAVPMEAGVDSLLIALEALGFRPAEAEQRARLARARLGEDAPVEELVKVALRSA
ncbi:MAG TPA: Holliday junction branch migration protein RuvA [Fredinandcohnia sp.]|nr:Holliday junction branch migration protein RuvA [Fredinandcohnia sp.]